jgi:hypothetical protein
MTRKLLTRRDPMGQVHAFVRVTNLNDASKFIECRAVVDTDASHLTLPAAWKEQLGSLEVYDIVEAETATQEFVPGEICGPVTIEIPRVSQGQLRGHVHRNGSERLGL